MIEFILNNTLIRTDNPQGMSLLDFIRVEMGLTGTKIGCREGDCGACTVMLGELVDGSIKYKSIVSCLTPLGSVHGKHVVSVEGLQGETLSPVQQAIVNHSGTQCGFCTPGFVMSLFSHSLSEDVADFKKTLASIDGNICRCTGYKSIEKAAKEIWELNQTRKNEDAVKWMVDNEYLPVYFSTIVDRLGVIYASNKSIHEERIIIGGGTDLMVQKADALAEANLHLPSLKRVANRIQIKNGICVISAQATANDILQSDELKHYFPKIQTHLKLVSSTPIRNMGTLGGNIINASPIGDLIVYFLALDAKLLISSIDREQRELALKDFYLGYKLLDFQETDYLEEVSFRLPEQSDHFNFEKVSKREHLDIASVNTAVLINIENSLINNIRLSAGGIAPIPMYLKNTCEYLHGKKPEMEILIQANKILQKEISPISDIRGSEEYKRLLMRQLFFAHFIELFPEEFSYEKY
ncbi:MAG: FAD binding domain-containing protein [Bacteroidales bacterium]|nr:FAD binding domain-containing protein [Bacteroidales bacterium]